MSGGLGPGARVAVAASVTLAAGALLGFVAGRQTAPVAGSALDPALEAWAAGASGALDLSREQTADLRILLAHYERERDAMLAASLARAEGDWLDLDRRFESLLLNRFLRPEQRAEAERLLAGSALAPLPPPR